MKPRLVSRLTNEYLLRVLDQLRAGFDGDIVKGMIFLAVTQSNVGHIDHDPGLAKSWSDVDTPPPDHLRRPVSAGAIASLLGLPKETARRKIRQMVEDRYCALAPGGVIVPRRVFLRPGNVDALVRHAADLRGFYAALAEHDIGATRDYALAPGQARLRQLGRFSAEYILCAVDGMKALFGGELLSGLIFMAITAANVRHITDAPGDLYAELDTPPPDTERRPISAMALSRELGIPAETVRRHVRQLERDGYCVARREGLVTPNDVLMRADFRQATAQSAAHVGWLLRQMAQVGVLTPRALAPI
ncbi:helix-turn-helix domain-containing protein [Phenylobacterium aquaticum]|uniref:helix-turn-helix domain-containing protein n=1 Tax=Phenylobacterium aquaticum TaxID=1763816 RepID=UPI0026EAED77|nr:helix-turn-helix domain-containing protein [Phenylobacterium aquaticum]